MRQDSCSTRTSGNPSQHPWQKKSAINFTFPIVFLYYRPDVGSQDGPDRLSEGAGVGKEYGAGRAGTRRAAMARRERIEERRIEEPGAEGVRSSSAARCDVSRYGAAPFNKRCAVMAFARSMNAPGRRVCWPHLSLFRKALGGICVLSRGFLAFSHDPLRGALLSSFDGAK